jgi:hypothetical protein
VPRDVHLQGGIGILGHDPLITSEVQEPVVVAENGLGPGTEDSDA